MHCEDKNESITSYSNPSGTLISWQGLTAMYVVMAIKAMNQLQF